MSFGMPQNKKAAAALQQQLMKMQEEIKNLKATGKAANDLVTVTLNGEFDLLSLHIKPECVDPADVEGLETLIRQAYNDAVRQIKNASFPGLPDGLPFKL